jgi:hypothetical protein
MQLSYLYTVRCETCGIALYIPNMWNFHNKETLRLWKQ